MKNMTVKNMTDLLKDATVGVFIIKLPGKKIIDANPSFAQILGYESLDSLRSGFVWEKHFSFTGMGKPSDRAHGMGTSEYREIQILRADGTIGWVNFSFGLYLKTGRLQGIVVDISDRKRLEGEILRISDLEREKFGRDLHDILGQTLTGTAFLCRALMQRLPKEPAGLEKHAGQIENLVNQALVQARNLAHGLAYTEVQPSGIRSQLKKLATQVNTVFGAKCKAKSPSRFGLPDRESATHLYWIAQEAVYNTVKHSGSPRVEIRLEKDADDGILTVEDFGKGLPRRLPLTKGIGMRLMKLRARLMGASVKFLNKKGRGFQVICNFPLAKEIAA